MSAATHDSLCRDRRWDPGECPECRAIDRVRVNERARVLARAEVRADEQATFAQRLMLAGIKQAADDMRREMRDG